MAETDYRPTPPCALCGEGEPSPVQSNGLCDLCRMRVLRVGEFKVVLDAELGRLVLLAPVDSKNIRRAGWHSGVLFLQFGLEPSADGRALVRGDEIFRYSNVDRAWWVAFLTSESKGRFFHQTVRADAAKHPFTKIP